MSFEGGLPGDACQRSVIVFRQLFEVYTFETEHPFPKCLVSLSSQMAEAHTVITLLQAEVPRECYPILALGSLYGLISQVHIILQI